MRVGTRENLPSFVVVVALALAFAIISVAISAAISSSRDEEIRRAATEAEHAASAQAAYAEADHARVLVGCVRGELNRAETNLGRDVTRQLWLAAAEQRDADAAAAFGDVAKVLRARADFYRRQIGRMHDAPALVRDGWRLPAGELRDRARAACRLAYPPPKPTEEEKARG